MSFFQRHLNLQNTNLELFSSLKNCRKQKQQKNVKYISGPWNLTVRMYVITYAFHEATQMFYQFTAQYSFKFKNCTPFSLCDYLHLLSFQNALLILLHERDL